MLRRLIYRAFSSGSGHNPSEGDGSDEPAEDGPASEMKYCIHCGSEIPRGALYCPFCGRAQGSPPQQPIATRRESGLRASIVKNRGRIRLALFFISVGLFFSGLFLGSQASLSQSEAEAIREELWKTLGSTPTPFAIARNNISISALFLIPVIGMVLLSVISYSTGIVISAVATLSGLPKLEMFLTLFLLPVTWMELVAYSLSTTQGVMLLLGILTKRFREEAGNLLKAFLVAVLLLILGALIESAMLSSP